jgi:hypothetical protein
LSVRLAGIESLNNMNRPERRIDGSTSFLIFAVTNHYIWEGLVPIDELYDTYRRLSLIEYLYVFQC